MVLTRFDVNDGVSEWNRQQACGHNAHLTAKRVTRLSSRQHEIEIELSQRRRYDSACNLRVLTLAIDAHGLISAFRQRIVQNIQSFYVPH